MKFALFRDHLGYGSEKRLEGTRVHAGEPAGRLLHQSQQETTVVTVTEEQMQRSRRAQERLGRYNPWDS